MLHLHQPDVVLVYSWTIANMEITWKDLIQEELTTNRSGTPDLDAFFPERRSLQESKIYHTAMPKGGLLGLFSP